MKFVFAYGFGFAEVEPVGGRSRPWNRLLYFLEIRVGMKRTS